MLFTSARNSSDRIEIVGLLEAGGGEDVDHLVGHHRLGDDLPDGMVEVLVALALAARPLGQYRAHGLEEAHVVADGERRLVRHGERERLRQLTHRMQQPVLAVLLRQDVLLRGRQQR
jgi:hypothetical protein